MKGKSMIHQSLLDASFWLCLHAMHWTCSSIGNLDKYNLQFEQIHLANWTNTCGQCGLEIYLAACLPAPKEASGHVILHHVCQGCTSISLLHSAAMCISLHYTMHCSATKMCSISVHCTARNAELHWPHFHLLAIDRESLIGMASHKNTKQKHKQGECLLWVANTNKKGQIFHGGGQPQNSKQKRGVFSKWSCICHILLVCQFMSPRHSDQMSERSKPLGCSPTTNACLIFQNQKCEWPTRSPTELFWTNKKGKKAESLKRMDSHKNRKQKVWQTNCDFNFFSRQTDLTLLIL